MHSTLSGFLCPGHLVSLFLSCVTETLPFCLCMSPLQLCWQWNQTRSQKNRTRLFFLLAAPLGSGIEHHLLHLIQLCLQTGKVEVCTLLGHCCKLCGSTEHRTLWDYLHIVLPVLSNQETKWRNLKVNRASGLYTEHSVLVLFSHWRWETTRLSLKETGENTTHKCQDLTKALQQLLWTILGVRNKVESKSDPWPLLMPL